LVTKNIDCNYSQEDFIMGKFARKAVKPGLAKQHKDKAVKNFMGGTSYNLSPLQTLRIMATSSIFGEPSYYRAADSGDSYLKRINNMDTFIKHSIFGEYVEPSTTTDQMMTMAIDNALSHDFLGTLQFAIELRTTFNMRLNPMVILTRAAMHPARAEFTSNNPGRFSEFVASVAKRPDDLTNMVEYFIATQGKKNKFPSVLKRAIANRLPKFDHYQIAKYQNKGIGLIDMARIVHVNGSLNAALDTLLKEGKVPMPQGKTTWRHLRSDGMSWNDILKNHMNDLTHFDIVNQLRSMFTEVNNVKLAKEVTKRMLGGVERGKLFPYRYYTAHKVISGSAVNHKGVILDALEEAIDVAVDNMPKLEGRTMVLSDNSGSAWGAMTVDGASTFVAEIGNLSAVITGMSSEDGYVGLFGDKLITHPVSKRNGALTQVTKMNEDRGRKVGCATENGIWIFFRDAINNKQHWDNIFVYSDMQAGHGGLYGTNPSEYRRFAYGRHINVLALLDEYKKKVNPKVNFFTVQTAGYDNNLIPEHIHRGAILAGWTGKEVLFAKALIDEWDKAGK
jgi:hypothetical protein